MQHIGAMGSLTPLIPTSEGVGLVEKRLGTYSNIGLSDVADFVGDFNHSASSVILLDDDADGHLNHGQDPATDTLNFLSVASQVMDKARDLESDLDLSDYAHASLDGYHPPGTGNGSGDPDLSQHDVTANETVAVGQPIYISGNETVNLANATSVNTANAIGLVLEGATANGTATILTEGSVNQADWTTVTGTANLTPGSVYFLDTTAGKMTTTPPSGSGNVVVALGTAINITKFDIEVNEIVQL